MIAQTYCFLLHQFWSIYLNICMKCIIITGENV